MCTEPHHHHPVTAAAPRIHPEPASAPADPITLAPVDAVTLTTLVDNSTPPSAGPGSGAPARPAGRRRRIAPGNQCA